MKPWHGIDGHVMADLMVENMASRERWGPQDHPLGINPDRISQQYEDSSKRMCQAAADRGECTWKLIIEEEWAEFLNAGSDEQAYQELVQLANVAFLAAESYKRSRRIAWQARQASAHGHRVDVIETGGAT